MSFESESSAEVWLKVTSKSRRRKKPPVFSCSSETPIDSQQSSVAHIKKRVEIAEEELLSSVFYSTFQETLDTCLGRFVDSVDEIICYGIGSISASVTSRFQLALVLLLRKKLQTSVLIYDPIFSEVDRTLLKELDCCVVTENDNALRKVNPNTLVVFPHVPKELINNFLQVNWYIMSQYRKYQVTELQHCKAQEEMRFLAETYLCYLKSVRKQNELHEMYRGKGERSIGETANLVGFKLPHDPK